MKTYLFGALALVQESIRQQHMKSTLADTMRLLTWDERKETSLWDSKPLKINPIQNVDQPGLGGEH